VQLRQQFIALHVGQVPVQQQQIGRLLERQA